MSEDWVPEERIDLYLQWAINAAGQHDDYEGRRLHEFLALALSEKEGREGRWWLTEFAKKILIEMHEELSRDVGGGDKLIEHVLATTLLKRAPGNKRNLGHLERDLNIMLRVDRLRQTKDDKGKFLTVTDACEAVANSGKFKLSAGSIKRIYYQLGSGKLKWKPPKGWPPKERTNRHK
jgi:hypothetical protein